VVDRSGLSGDVLPALGSLLELIHGAQDPFECVEATYRIWRHDERASAAWHAEIEEQKKRGAAVTAYASATLERPVEHEEVLRIWRAGDRVRAEHEGGPRDGAYAVRDRDAWWSWDETNGAMSNQDDPDVGFSVGEEVSILLDPTSLLGSLSFTVEGRSQVAGRETISASAGRRLRDPRRHLRAFELHQLGAGAERYALEFDVQRGVLLEVVALWRGEPFHRVTTVAIEFDHTIPSARFRFEAPAGEKIRSSRSRHRLVHVSLPDAQQRAPFTVLIPDRVPPDWHVRCAFIEPSDRPPAPAAISLNYLSDDGHESVSLSQYSAADKPSHYDLMTDDAHWTTIARDGAEVRVTKPQAGGSQAQAYIEREGTFVFLISETLGAEQLATMAAGLKAAPSVGSI
jgi:hypothetical protein